MKFCSLGFLVLFVLFVYVDVVVSDRGLSCPLPRIKNGRIRSRQRGRIVKFVCQPGFQLAGERNAFCINGTWDMPTPKCVKTTCPKNDSPPPNGLILPSHGGGVLNFYCKQGFDLHGPAAVYCDGFTWDNPAMPSCIPSNTKPSLFCDFESSDLCHWTHDLNHDMDWKLDSYKTPTGYSMETGPSFDHTKGEGSNGHYMYIESSSRRINDTARLISPIFDKMPNNTCLEFWYHMYGKTTGTLRAYIKKVSDPWPLRAENAIFSKSGNQGDKWYKAIINLGVIDQDFQIIMEGIRGNGYVSDTAIDDVRIIPNCVYEDYIFTTTEAPLPVSEILKSVDSCENRCGNKSSGHEGPSIISCDCDDFCYEHSRCCPDFIDFCFSSTSTFDFETTTDMQSFTEKAHLRGDPTLKTAATPKRTPPPTIKTTTVKLTTKKTIPTTKKIPPPLPTKKVIPTTKMTPPTTQKTPATTKKAPTRKPTQKIPPNLPTRRPLILLTPSTVPVIYRKTLPTTTIINPLSKIAFVKPKNISMYTNKPFNDEMEVPTKQNNDEELLLTSPLPFEEDNNIPLQDREDYVERISNEKELLESNDVNPENIGQIKTEFSQHQTEVSNVKTTFIVIVTLICVAALASVTAMLLVKYRVIGLRRRRMMSGHGNSQSDVRFLTADEVLDFSVDNDEL